MGKVVDSDGHVFEPHDVWVEQVHAIVVLNADASVTEQELIDHAREAIRAVATH